MHPELSDISSLAPSSFAYLLLPSKLKMPIESWAESHSRTSRLTSPRSPGFGTTATGNTTTPFGQPRPFGAQTTGGGGIFGGTSTATAGTGSAFGGFGNTANQQQQQPTSSPFGGGNNAFGGGAKPFGATGSTGSGLFGGGGTFGSSNTNPGMGAFGAPASTALNTATPQPEGTGGTPFQAFTDKEQGSTTMNHFQAITFQSPYQKFSFEVSHISRHDEVKVAD